eukprot:1480582-Rhodomonas_salina.1
METDHTWTLDDVEQNGAEGDGAEPDADMHEGDYDWFNEGARMGVSADQMRQLEDLAAANAADAGLGGRQRGRRRRSPEGQEDEQGRTEGGTTKKQRPEHTLPFTL